MKIVKKRRQFVICCLLIISTLLLFSCGVSGLQEEGSITLQVSAAASLTDAMVEIAKEYSLKESVSIQFNFGGSGAIKTQIIEGAPCDVFISASVNHMNDLVESGIVLEETKIDLLKNTLVLIAAREKSGQVSIESLTTENIDSISIGEPETVPAGQYAKEALTGLKLWDTIEEKLIYAKDVRAVLQYVESGNVDCGILYRTDAVLLETGTIIESFPATSHTPIIYSAALLSESKHIDAGARFLEYLMGEEARIIFEKHGFTVK